MMNEQKIAVQNFQTNLHPASSIFWNSVLIVTMVADAGKGRRGCSLKMLLTYALRRSAKWWGYCFSMGEKLCCLDDVRLMCFIPYRKECFYNLALLHPLRDPLGVTCHPSEKSQTTFNHRNGGLLCSPKVLQTSEQFYHSLVRIWKRFTSLTELGLGLGHG